jgi:tetratricopeptide (TPR) repeat protein
MGLATVYWELGQFETAEKYLQQVLTISPNAPQALFQLGNIRVRQHRDEEAIPFLQRFLALEPDSLSACADLGRAYFHLGQYDQALPYLQKARAIDQKGDIHYQLATVLRRLERERDAAEAMRVSDRLRKSELERQERLHGSR